MQWEQCYFEEDIVFIWGSALNVMDGDAAAKRVFMGNWVTEIKLEFACEQREVSAAGIWLLL